MVGVTLALGLMLEAVCLAAMLVTFRTRIIGRVGGLFLIMALAFHGLSELLVQINPSADPYRNMVSPLLVADWVVSAGVALTVFTVVYLWVSTGIPNLPAKPGEPEGGRLLRLVDWRAALLVTLPLEIYTVRGAGYAASSTPGNYASSGLSDQFLIVAVVITAYLYLVKHEGRRLLLVLGVQSVALAFVGQRLEIAVGAVMLLFALRRTGVTLTRRQTGAIIGGLALFVLVISSARVVQGREAFQTVGGPSARAQALVSGLTHLDSPAGVRDAVTQGYVDRFDGDAYPAFMLRQTRVNHVPPAGGQPLVNDLSLAVPRFVNPAKLDTAATDRDEKAYIDAYYGWPPRTDVVEGQLAGAFGMFGRWGLYLVAGLLGLGFAALDRWLERSRGVVPLIVGLGFVQAVMFYERGFQSYTLTLRGTLLLTVLGGVLWFIRVAPGKLRAQLRPDYAMHHTSNRGDHWMQSTSKT